MGWIDALITAFRPGPAAPLPESWLFFTTQRHGQTFGVFCNTALAEIIADRAEDHLIAMLRCRIEVGGPVLAPDEDAALERLANRMERLCTGAGGLFLGRTTGGGNRCHYFLLPKSRAALADDLVGLAEKAGYSALVKLSDGPPGAIYAADLMPSPAEMRQALDAMAVTHLENSGDMSGAIHRVEHWAVFPDAKAAQGFAETVAQEGYELVPRGSAENPLAVQFAHLGKTTLEAISPTTHFADAAARQFGGTYDGWGTQVVTKAKA